jgi:hypothetical protein
MMMMMAPTIETVKLTVTVKSEKVSLSGDVRKADALTQNLRSSWNLSLASNL